ncbi:hypothetical protein CVD28_03320 [Bacillus sp. M6-12]|uniref:hypothetical protein n=1 Tax=Bacillus sp. M6-12 TaxID=2054166 RepID=UPI000C79376D|nr:hypothetical protein [Bacillus sp. M6-12]PLS19460.1 hypothetical protein CVD28_03320 [Bacillus sp. M6-12]
MEKAVTLILDPVTIIVEGKTDKELLENAKKAYIEQLEKQFPHFSYSVNEADVLTFDTVKVGMVVENKSGEKGIVTSLNKKTINVTLTGHRAVQGAPQAFKKSSATFDESRSKRHEFMKPDWTEGDTGYLETKERIVEVVVGKKAGAKFKVYEVNGSGGHYTLDSKQIQAFLKDDKTETK